MEMARMIAEDELRDAAFLIIANKQDLPKAMSVEEALNPSSHYHLTIVIYTTFHFFSKTIIVIYL